MTHQYLIISKFHFISPFPNTYTWADPEGGQGVRTPSPEKITKNIGLLSKKKGERLLSNTGPDPLKNHKTTEQALNVGPSSARQRNAI